MKIEAAQRLVAKAPFDLTEIERTWKSLVQPIFHVPHGWLLVAKAVPMPLGTGFYLNVYAGEEEAHEGDKPQRDDAAILWLQRRSEWLFSRADYPLPLDTLHRTHGV